MNFTELKTEFFARGTNYLEEDAAGVTRAEGWLNQAYREICNLHPWPFLVTSVTGAAGTGIVSVPDLRRILLVSNTETGGDPGMRLRRSTYEALAIDDGADLTTTGTPQWYYVDNGYIKTWPLGGTIKVRYAKRVAPLTGNDVPIFDEEYHNLIVDKAMIKAYIDGDNYEAAASLKLEVNDLLVAMGEDYMVDSREVTFIHVNDPYDG